MLKADFTFDLRQLYVIGLHHFGFGIDQGEDTFTRRQTQLELTPERGDAGQREPEQRQPLNEQIPFASRQNTILYPYPAEINQRRRTKTRQQVQNREDAAEGITGAQIDAVRLCVDIQEFIVDRLFLAEGFGDADTADRFLNMRADHRVHPPRVA